MKQFSLIFFATLAGFLFAQDGNDPVLMTIKNTPIHKSEFEYLYNKNNTQNTLDKKSLSEYLTLFENFKMKVLEAEALGMDTTRTFLEELAGYRRQLTPVYLTDTVIQNRLVQEAYNRLKEDVDVSHILIRTAPNATAADTLAAYNKIASIYERTTREPRTTPCKCSFFAKLFGKCKTKTITPEDFNQVARKESEDPTAAENSGHLGFVSGFMTIYPFENRVYNTPVGQISAPFRTPYGYHIIKINGRRPSRGKLQVAHIMKFVQKDASDSVKAQMKAVIDSLYKEIKSGVDFGALAKKSSDDKSSAANGGILPWFGSGSMVKEFEDAAFALKKGEVSPPVLSPYGWHIIKLIDAKQLEPLAEKKAEIERRIQHDERANIIAQSFVDRLRAIYQFRDSTVTLAPFYQLVEKYALQDTAFINDTEHMTEVMAHFADQTLTQCDFANFLSRHPNSELSDKRALINEKYQQFINTALANYKDDQLEKEYPEFGNLMREYHDGILLFSISNEKVWDKATRDTKGLESFFKANRRNYTWSEPRFKGLIISCKNAATQAKIKEMIAKTPKDSIESYLRSRLNNRDTVFAAKIEKGLYVKGDNKAVDKLEFKTGDFTPSATFPVVFTYGKMLKNGPESYADVMGILISDYQTYLEEQWIKELRRKYTVTINQNTLKTIKEN